MLWPMLLRRKAETDLVRSLRGFKGTFGPVKKYLRFFVRQTTAFVVISWSAWDAGMGRGETNDQ